MHLSGKTPLAERKNLKTLNIASRRFSYLRKTGCASA